MEQTTFTDSDGVVWSVREDGADDPRALAADVPPGTTWLRFESELEVQAPLALPGRLAGTEPLQLESLLDRASTVIARFRPATHSATGRGATLDPQRPGSAQVPATPTGRTDRPSTPVVAIRSSEKGQLGSREKNTEVRPASVGVAGSCTRVGIGDHSRGASPHRRGGVFSVPFHSHAQNPLEDPAHAHPLRCHHCRRRPCRL